MIKSTVEPWPRRVQISRKIPDYKYILQYEKGVLMQAVWKETPTSLQRYKDTFQKLTLTLIENGPEFTQRALTVHINIGQLGGHIYIYF